MPPKRHFSASGSHLVEGEEVYGLLNSIQPIDNETVRAQIGPEAGASAGWIEAGGREARFRGATGS